ncbi:MAG: adenylate/guanylate cyclase domain-containing protein [Azospirillaceae bacterium]
MAETVNPDRPRRSVLPRSLSLSLTLAISIGLLVLIAVAGTLGVATTASVRNTLSLLQDKANLVLDNVQSALFDYLRPAETMLAGLAREIEAGRLDPGDNDRFVDTLRGGLLAEPQVLSIGYWDAEASMVGAARQGDRVLEMGASGPPPPQIERAIADSIARSEAYWGEAIFSPEIGGAVLNRRQPVFDGDELVGYLVASVSVRQLSAFLAQVGRSVENGRVFILDGEDVVAHPRLGVTPLPTDLQPVVGALSPDRPLPSLRDIGDPALVAFWDELREERAGDGDERNQRQADPFTSAALTARFVEVGGDHERLFLMRRFALDGGNEVWLGTHFAASTITSEIRRLLGSLGVGIVILIVSVLLGVLVGRRIARPVIRLANSAGHIAETLDFTNAQPLPGSIFTELDRQANAFNRMVGGLRWLETYVPRSLVRRLVDKADGESVVSVSRPLTVMFTDIAGFTSTTEDAEAEETADFLNHHFDILARAVEDERGTIDKFLGDGMLAFWGAPEKLRDHADRALRAALAIRAAIEADNRERRAAAKPPVRLRIGLHTGPVVVGNIGATDRMNYTVVGDPVNVGNRIERLAGERLDVDGEVAILLSEATLEALSEPPAGLVDLGPRLLRGRSEEMRVFAVAPAPSPMPA